jgi:hypothetical protein
VRLRGAGDRVEQRGVERAGEALLAQPRRRDPHAPAVDALAMGTAQHMRGKRLLGRPSDDGGAEGHEGEAGEGVRHDDAAARAAPQGAHRLAQRRDRAAQQQAFFPTPRR